MRSLLLRERIIARSEAFVGFLAFGCRKRPPQAKDLEGQAEPVGLEPTHPHGRRFSRPNGGVPLSTSKAVYVPFTTIFRRRFSLEGPLRPCKVRYAGNESGNPTSRSLISPEMWYLHQYIGDFSNVLNTQSSTLSLSSLIGTGSSTQTAPQRGPLVREDQPHPEDAGTGCPIRPGA